MTARDLDCDDAFFAAFNDCSAPPCAFNHLGHIRIGWIHLQRYPVAEAIQRTCDGIERFANHLGVPGKYNRTLSEALMILMAQGGAADQGKTWDIFLADNAELVSDALGLLTPARRDANGYRLYGPQQIERLRAIRAYRDAGLSIPAIQSLLTNTPDVSMQLLEDRLLDIDREISSLREQQITLARLLAQATSESPGKVASKDAWVALMRNAGFSEEDMKRWHAVFEAQAPEAHLKFLESLSLSKAEVKAIREWARGRGCTLVWCSTLSGT